MHRPATRSQPAWNRAAGPATARPRFPVWLMAVLLGLVTLALYWPATRGDFVDYDDGLLVTANAQVQQGLTWQSIKWAWFNPVNCIWHPITVWSHMLDCQLFGLKPWGHHLSSVLLHAVNTGLVFLLLRGLTGALWRSVLVAALFGWHPLHVESVAWVSERKDVLSGFFGLLALMAYARYAEQSAISIQSTLRNPPSSVLPRRIGSATGDGWSLSHLPASICYLLSLFCFALGLMSKPVLVAWPFVMLLLDYWPLRRLELSLNLPGWLMITRRSGKVWRGSTINSPPRQSEAPAGQLSTIWRLAREKIPFFVLAALASVVTFVVQQRAGALAAGKTLPLGARSGNALISYCRYLEKLFWPTDLAVYYPHPGHWLMGKVLLAGGVILGIFVLVWVLRRRLPFLLTGWLWYCGTLVPMSQVIQTGGHGMADRYSYLPSIGVLILTIWGAYELTRRWRYQLMVLSTASGVGIALCLALTRQQIGYWSDSEALFRHALEVTEDSDVAHNGLGVAFDKKGQTDEAISQYQEAIRLEPGYIEPHYNLGIALTRKGQVDEGIREFQEAIRLKPDYAPAHNDLGIALGRKGQIDEAVSQLQEAIRLKPDHAEAHSNLGVALAKRGQVDEAILQYQEALRLKPDQADFHCNLGVARDRKGQTEEAIRQFQEALRLRPDYADARRNLNAVLAAQGAASPPPGGSTNR